MTPANKTLISHGLLALIVSAVSAFAITQYKVGQLERDLEWVKGRLTDIYCATVPQEKQRGCR
jgi:hypothetical protein